ncbi:amidase [Microlunatus panaciterrae]|uniref:Asp-tRNA(Asn)/Glu-tRNA(Gln) amidotransferase A subunit family amidase n=1 Tax=Microlunatus panaciterrae TaxID=400768 RepID=A0ABS2RDJ2_9ACTN|nr:amidase [Microlunatus panaciterrae]MBM7797081.1 Asp-tRNA(Asn)/Glu-tRNA(Gln) amidotransferase A subunit family amidase [Microlunatus panaciterrae]
MLMASPRSLVADVSALRAGALDLGRHLADTCDRIDAAQPALHAFVPEADRRGRLAAALSAEQTRTPLAGAMVGVKDIIRVAGLTMTAGSQLPPELFAGPQADVVNRLVAGGALVAGATVTAEFAVAAPGPTTNPHDRRHTPGGSSSGSAAAVAAGLVPLAIGTQTVGSVIRPAAYCGVVGFRPTYGSLPVDGVVANAPSLDTLGVFTADVASAVLAAQVLLEGLEVPLSSRPRLLVATGRYLDQADPVARSAFDAQVGRLRAAGFSVSSADPVDDLDALTRHLLVINRYELAQVHAEWFSAFADLYRPQTAEAILDGLATSAEVYAEARQYQRAFTERLTASLAAHDADAWLTPAATGTAPRGLESTGNPAMNVPFSVAGAPAITIPAGRLGRLPLGLQLAGRPGDDASLLGGALTVEAALSG